MHESGQNFWKSNEGHERHRHIAVSRKICPQARTNCEPSSGFYMEILSDFFVILREVVAAVAAGWTSATILYMGDMNKWTRARCVFSHYNRIWWLINKIESSRNTKKCHIFMRTLDYIFIEFNWQCARCRIMTRGCGGKPAISLLGNQRIWK